MSKNWVGSMFTVGAAIALAVFGLCSVSGAQQVTYAMLQPNAPLPDAPARPAAVELSPFTVSTPSVSSPATPEAHRFWDRENSILFAATAAFSTADFVVTRDNLRNGGQELNPVTRVFSSSTAGLAMNFAGETVGVVGVSYFLHRMGHHRLERAVSMLNIGGSATAVAFDLVHR
jgi:hypothetical protein